MAAEGVWIRVNPDGRGYTDTFKCSNCGQFVVLRMFAKECEFPNCPWCRCELTETEEA